MTLRITVAAGQEATVCALHGWLSGPEVTEFERVVGPQSLPLQIDLAHLVGTDSSGIAALCAQRSRGVRLANMSPYFRLLLEGHD